ERDRGAWHALYRGRYPRDLDDRRRGWDAPVGAEGRGLPSVPDPCGTLHADPVEFAGYAEDIGPLRVIRAIFRRTQPGLHGVEIGFFAFQEDQRPAALDRCRSAGEHFVLHSFCVDLEQPRAIQAEVVDANGFDGFDRALQSSAVEIRTGNAFDLERTEVARLVIVDRLEAQRLPRLGPDRPVVTADVVETVERYRRSEQIEDLALRLEGVHRHLRERKAGKGDRVYPVVGPDVENFDLALRSVYGRQHPAQQLDFVLLPRAILDDTAADHAVVAVDEQQAVLGFRHHLSRIRYGAPCGRRRRFRPAPRAPHLPESVLESPGAACPVGQGRAQHQVAQPGAQFRKTGEIGRETGGNPDVFVAALCD